MPILMPQPDAGMVIDLHSHSSCSDGALAPGALLARADEQGVEVLAITDHDTVDAFHELTAGHGSLQLIAGVEFSTQWQSTGIHVLGLDIDPGSAAIRAGVRYQTEARRQRAHRIGEVLEKKGIPDALAGASALAPGDYIGRPHFARYLVNIGRAKSIEDAFRKFMGDGKVGDIRQHWADLPQVVQWIRDAGGIAVLAHPLKYKLTRTKLKRLLAAFMQAGGQGMEVVSGQQNPQMTAAMGQLCEQMNLLASCGSDFHVPDTRWAELGRFPALPRSVTPVWDRFF
jgi:predicted metal-dependent phosphoesterase TrpH